MADLKNNPVEIDKNSNIRRKARLFLELLSFMTMFFIFSVIMFSMLTSSEAIRTISINFSITVPIPVFWILGVIYFFLTATCLFLLFSNSSLIKVNDWFDKENPTGDKMFARLIWPLIWMALILTFITAILDASNRLPDYMQNPARVIGTIFISLSTIRLLFYATKKRATH